MSYIGNNQHALIEQSFCRALLAEYTLIKQSTYKNMLAYLKLYEYIIQHIR